MYNYTIVRLAGAAVFRIMFAAGTLVGGFGGIILGLLDRETIGIAGGLFLGFVFGLFSGSIGLIYALVFNKLAPVVGGIPVKLEVVIHLHEQDESPHPSSSE
jgi:hypothetical protein